MSEEIDKLSQDISESNEIKPHIIDVDFIASYSGKVINLLNGDGVNSEKLDNRYYYFKFQEPIYIHEISFTPEENTNLLGLEIITTNLKGEESTIRFTKKEHVTALPKKIITEFKIKPKNKLVGKTTLKKIELFGFLVNELNSIKEKVEEVGSYKIDLQSKLEELIQKNKDYNDKENRTNELNDKIPKLQKNKTELEEKISNLENTRASLKGDNQTLKDSTSQLQAESDNLNKEIPKQKQKLKELVRDKSIFSTEMKEYIKQADNHIKIYFILSLIPWLLIVCFLIVAFNNAADLATIYNSLDGEIDIFAIFWTRLPFALIIISILFVTYEISKLFVQNMMKIQSQKRVFAKIGIVAKDVADSSILGIKDLTDEEIFELRTKIKMDLLKAHLSNDIGEDYEYNIKTSLFERFSHLFKKSE